MRVSIICLLFSISLVANSQAIPKNINRSEFDKALEQKVLTLESQLASIKKSSFGVNVQDWGVLPSNTPEQNSTAIEKLINSYAQGSAPFVFIPEGSYYFARSIVLDGKPFHLKGANGSHWATNSTKLFFPDGKTGLYIDRKKTNDQGAIIENICFIAQGNSKPFASGINYRARVTIRNCTAKGFSHNGFDGWANIESEGTDISGSLLEACVAVENKNDGFFTGRSDGNTVLHIACDARDNGRYGFNDDSFLGNIYIATMAHYNKGGDIWVRDAINARTLVSGFYSEGGNTPSKLTRKSTVIGGTWGTGYKIENDPIRYSSYDQNENSINEKLMNMQKQVNDLKNKLERFKK